MRTDQDQANHADFAEIWRKAQHRRVEDIGESDIDILKAVALFCGPGLLVSLLFAIQGLDLSLF